ncbi:MAG: hypothetical protein MJ231_05255 [bacterium]|nr:hypothetical protein [bacterium]
MKRTTKKTLALSMVTLFTVMTVQASTFEISSPDKTATPELLEAQYVEEVEETVTKTPSFIGYFLANLLKRNIDYVTEDMLLENYMLGCSSIDFE